MLSLGRHCSTPIHMKTPQHPQSGGLHVPELPWPTIAIAPFSAIETLRPEGAKRFSDLMTGELTEFAWLLSPKLEDAWVRPAWPRGTASGLEERRRWRAPGLTSAAERVPAERARGRPQQRQGGPGERSGGRAPSAHPGRTRPCHPPRHLWRQRCARGLGLGGRALPDRGSPGALRAVPARTPTEVARTRAGAGRPGQGAIFSGSCSPSRTDRTS